MRCLVGLLFRTCGLGRRLGWGSNSLVILLAGFFLVTVVYREGKTQEAEAGIDRVSNAPLPELLASSGLVPATQEAREASSIPFYRRPLAPAIYTGRPLPLPAEASPQFQGLVLDTDGNPVEGAQIHAVALSVLGHPIGPNGVTSTTFRIPRPLKRPRLSVGPVRATTDDQGNFAFDAPDLMVVAADGQPAFPRIILFANADGLGPDTHFVSVGTSLRTPFRTFRLDRDDVPVRGRLLNSEGGPLVDAEVELDSIGIPRDFAEHLDRLRTAMPTDSGPSARATVQGSWDLPGLTRTTRTDSDGWFELRGYGRDRFISLLVSGEGLQQTRISHVTRPREDWPELAPRYQEKLERGRAMREQFGYDPRPLAMMSSEPNVWRIESSPVVSGRIVDRESGKGVSGMLIAATASRGPDAKNAHVRESVGTIHATSDSDGRFRFTMPYGIYEGATHIALATRAPSGGTHFGNATYLPIPDEDRLADHLGLQIDVDRGFEYRISVSDDDGQPVSDAEIFASSLPLEGNTQEQQTRILKRSMLPALEIEPGVYQGLMTSRESLVFVNAPDSENYRSAYIDEKRPDGDGVRVRTASSRYPQRSYEAIVSTVDSGKVSTTGEILMSVKLQRQDPLVLRLVRGDGTIVHFATTRGFDISSAPSNPVVRDGTIAVHALHPKRKHTFRFVNREENLVGQITVDGSMEGTVDVLMQVPGSVEGRLVDSEGSVETRSRKISFTTVEAEDSDSSYTLGAYREVKGGEFRMDNLVPGKRYRMLGIKGMLGAGRREFVVESGQTLQLGDIVWLPAN